MKMQAFALFVVIAFVVAVASAKPKGPIWEKHKGKSGLNGDKITCVYCHGKDKANLQKKKDTDVKQAKKGSFCAVAECHPRPTD